MRILQHGPEAATVALSRQELTLLANCINETLEAVGEDEFSTRTGSSLHVAEMLQQELQGLLRLLGPAKTP